MGNRAIITLEDDSARKHPVALYLHWNGGLESVLAFVTYAWDNFERGHDDVYTFHARLCQTIGNYFPDGLSLYGYPLSHAQNMSVDNGIFHFRIGKDSFELLHRADEVPSASQHAYWTESPSIFDSIRQNMPAAKGGA